MPIDASIALQGKAPQFDNPVNYLVQAQKLQQAQNENALFPMLQQEQRLKLAQAQRMGGLMQRYYDMFSGPTNALAGQPAAPAAVGNALATAPESGGATAAAPGPNALAQPGSAASAQPSGFPMSMQQVAMANMLGLPGAKEMVDLYKYNNDGIKIDAGSYRKDPNTGAISYFADPTKGFNIDPGTGAVSALPGFAQANAAIEGAKSAATAKAVNDNTVADPGKYIGADGKPFTGTVGQLVSAVGGAPAAPVGPRFVGADLLDQLPPAQAAALRQQIAKSGGKAAINFNTADGRHVQGDVDLTRAAGGYTPPSVGQDGHPIPEQLQAALVHVADSRDPAKLQALQQQMLDKINAMPDSPQKQAALQNVAAEAQRIQQYWQGGAPQAGQQGFAFASPTDIALDKDQREANLKFSTDLRSKAHDSNVTALNNLHDTVRNEWEIQNRNKQLLPMLDKIQTGGFAPEGRIQFANALQNSGLVPDALKGTLGQWVANGDPTTGKVIENQLAAAGIKTMLDTLDKEGKPNRAIFDAIQNAQESVRSGNATLKQVFALQKQLYDMHYQQEQDMAKTMASPDYNPLTMQADFSRRRNDSLASERPVTAPPAAGAPGAVPAAPAAQAGWSIKRVK